MFRASRSLIALGALVGSSMSLASCSSSDDTAASTTPAGPQITREVFLVKGVTPPPNPDATSNAATPEEYNQVRVVRYRLASETPKPARAIAVLMPGFLGGASSFDGLARALVARSDADGAIEAWAIDRRSNLLEDHHGNDVAEAAKDPSLVSKYYSDGVEVEGKTFAGYLAQSEVSYMSEWGMATTIGDLRAVIEEISQTDRKAHVVLLGHSLGATIVETYAAWDFDGTAGYDELAGLVLVDGVSGNEGGDIASTRDDYEKGGTPAPGGFGNSPGVNGVRKTQRYFALPLLGLDVYTTASRVAMRSVWSPNEITSDDQRDGLLEQLLGLSAGSVPKMTNRAAMGLAFDNETNGLSFAAVSLGQASGGAMTDYTSLFGGALKHPSDPSATYSWVDYDKSSPIEHASIDELARTWFDGPELDFAEWYFPYRLTVDASIGSSLVLKPGDWPLDDYAIKATHGAEMDLPIYAFAAGLLGGDTKNFDALKTLVSSGKGVIGDGRPLAGKPRSDKDAFRAEGEAKLTHIDPLVGVDDSANLTGQWYDRLSTWIKTNTTSGGVVIPKRLT